MEEDERRQRGQPGGIDGCGGTRGAAEGERKQWGHSGGSRGGKKAAETDGYRLFHPKVLADKNTITRAELAAILAALVHAGERPTLPATLTVFTDSLASIYLARTSVQRPDTHSGSCAMAAATNPSQGLVVVLDGLNGYLCSLPAWPCVLPTPTSHSMPSASY